MVSWAIVLAIILSIAISYKLKMNTGILAIAFAYLIGSFLLKMEPASIIALWPVPIFFVILAVTLFFNFAVVNGTLEKISSFFLYKSRHFPFFLPLVILFTALLMAALGAGYYAIMVLLVPVTLIACKRIGLDPLIGALAVSFGAQAGANFMVSANGVIFRGLIASDGFSKSFAFSESSTIFITYLVIALLVVVSLISLKKNRSRLPQEMQSIEMVRPEPLEPKQKINLALILLFVVVLLVPAVLHALVPANVALTAINSKIDVGLVAIFFTVIASVLRLANEKEVLAKVPWHTLMMISGVGILIGVAIKAGTIGLLAHWVGTSVPVFLVPLALCLIAALMTSFSSLIGVVAPALFPIVASVAHLSGLDPVLLYTCIVIGGLSAAISPFSSGGAIVLGFCTNENERQKMFSKELLRGWPISVGSSLAMSVVLFAILR
ncbi:MAG: SLC13 family permease [Sporolactobacillus sp.]